MKESCQTSWILQDQIIVLLDYKHILFFEESEKDFQGNSEIIRAATPTRGSVCRVVSSSVSGVGRSSGFLKDQNDLALQE